MSTSPVPPKLVLITGGARGIGYGIARRFAGAGHAIAIADLNENAAVAAAATLAKDFHIPAAGVRCDVSRSDEVKRAVGKVVEQLGEIDILVNNAGICDFIHVMDLEEDCFRRTLDVNLVGAFLCTQTVARRMIARGEGGRIIFITSLSVYVTNSTQAHYAASKGGMEMLMKGFAIALGEHRITCNGVAPGMILTDMTRWHWDKPENAAKAKVRLPLQRLGTPDDVAGAVLSLCSAPMDYVTGINLIVDGGFLAKAD
jgi:NAD(P)-dependent dehydrogenase (short-subunit alcohol dehydrogenase family)